MPSTYLVAAYHVDKLFGGREEGGWWYDAGQIIRVVRKFNSQDKAYDYCNRLNRKLHSRRIGPNQGRRELSSVLSDGVVQAVVCEDWAVQHYPDRKPHYE